MQSDLEKLYPKKALESLDLYRKQCKICNRFFWTKDKNREVCGDHENYGFIKNPLGTKLSYNEVYDNFAKYMNSRGYISINRYPVVARWRDDIDFVIASIADFQPWVVEGYTDPPSKKLTVPQFCLRFNDIDNVGLTGRHYTGFVMIGQHAFMKPEEYNKDQYFLDLYYWFEENKFPMEEFLFHEDKWEGGGNGGTSIEFFIRGLEVANQVYMQYKIIDNQWVELDKLKVLDMGMGQERIAWITNGTPTSYDIVFPNTVKFLLNNINYDIDYDLFNKISMYSSLFDFEKYDINDFEKYLREKGIYDNKLLEIMHAIYLISDHIRTLYIAISDGALPSNMGGNYNLRLISRRMFYFIDKYFGEDSYSFIKKLLNYISLDWREKVDINEIYNILIYEYEKYKDIKKNAQKLLDKNLDTRKIFELYTSSGISLEIMKDINPNININKEEFSRLLSQHKNISKKENKKEEFYIDINYPETYKSFYDSWKKYYEISKFYGKIDYKNSIYYIFDRTVFYPTKGGQIHDTGYIFDLNNIKKYSKDVLDNYNFPDYVKDELVKYMTGNLKEDFEKYFARVVDVIEYKKIILHKVDKDIEISGEILQIIDKGRRYRISRHHTATHLLTSVLRNIYGNHIWQAGAEKDEYEGRLDITHYKVPSYEEIKLIEKNANNIILEGRKINKFYLKRNEAEKLYGFTIYQGGFIPETNLRIVNIENTDVEACSGTHLDNTLEIGLIKIISVEKIADGMIRFRFIAGDRIIEEYENMEERLNNIRNKYGIDINNLNNYIEKINKDREENSKKINSLLEEYIRNNIKDGRIYMETSLKISDIIKYVLRYKDIIKDIEIKCKDGIISSKGGDKKIDKFYIKNYE
ncbi:alanine--tRNA ligase [Nanobdella aerobiophila]|uniref:Alanine--tRNA ligase n=1 Tax=Nanobdella aerobiophila TaxID=2586965 RepID=A0A915WRV2_9ARCH|nr:alanine--tRNA ligase-related protein [Nanobdella aerobiophila]BBL45236.1 alanine--tRNA ligase [Nanobdella aerobiophila]